MCGNGAASAWGYLRHDGECRKGAQDGDSRNQGRERSECRPSEVHSNQRRRPDVGDGYESESDRKSTRLNSSHLGISYAVFCLKKKKKKNTIARTDTSHSLAPLSLMFRRMS